MSSNFYKKLQSDSFVHTVEINPPASHNPEDTFAEIKELPQEIDAIDITNCAFSKLRINPISLGHLIQTKFGYDVIVNYTCRDRNVLSTKSDLLGALALGIENVLCMTGDDPKIGDHPEATCVTDLHTCSLIEICKQLKCNKSSFSVGATTAAEDDETSLQKLKAKLDAGADYFITQPVYTEADVETVARLQEIADRPFIMGLLPFKNAAMAKRLSQVPGFNVPEELINKLESLNEEDIGNFSVECLFPIVKKAKKLLNGIHIMFIGETWKVPPLINVTF